MPPLASHLDPAQQVQPGDLITAEFMNSILARLRALEQGQAGPPGAIIVPQLVSRTVAEAEQLLAAAALNLGIGLIIDVQGKALDRIAPNTRQRVIVAQAPVAASRVAAATSIQLTVAGGQDQGGGDRTPSIFSHSPDPVRSGDDLTIFGSNFSSTPSANTVRFGGANGVPGEVQRSTGTSIVVRVPPGIPDLSTDPNTQTSVVVQVTTNGSSRQTIVNVRPGPLNDQPVITELVPNPVLLRPALGAPLVVRGANLTTDSTVGASLLVLEELGLTLPLGPGPDGPFAFLPANFPGRPPAGSSTTVTVRVQIGDRLSAGHQLNIESQMMI